MSGIIKAAFGGEIEKASLSASGGTFHGYASRFNVRDAQGEIVRKGAFIGAVGKTLPLLVQHDHARVAGAITIAGEDDAGLRVRGTFALDTREGAEAASLARLNARKGLSIGGRVVDASGSVPRYLNKIDLREISIVAVGACDGAEISALEKAAQDIADASRRNLSDFAYALKALGPTFPREESRSPFTPQWSDNDPVFPRAFDFIRREEVNTGSVGLVGVIEETPVTTNTAEGAAPASEYDAKYALVTSPSLQWAVVPVTVGRELLDDAASCRAWLDRAIVRNCLDLAELACVNTLATQAGSIPIGTDFLSACSLAVEFVAKKNSPTVCLVNSAEHFRHFGVRDLAPKVGGTVPIIGTRAVPVGTVLALNRDCATFFASSLGIDVAWAPGDGLVKGLRRVQAMLGHSTHVGAASGVSKATYP